MENTVWQLQEAKNKFSEVVDRALTLGPQEITRHGKKTAVVLSMDDFNKMSGNKESLVDFFQNSPLRGLDFERQKDQPRDVTF